MSRDPRSLLKRPRSPRKWSRDAYVLVGVLFVVVILVLASAIGIALSEFPPGKPADPWAAEGAIFGIGAFVLAVLATAIATVAYINSTEKPSMQLDDLRYPGSDTVLAPDWRFAEPDLQQATVEWSLALRLRNDGPVAARFIAVRVTFGENAFLYGQAPPKWQALLRGPLQLGDFFADDTSPVVRWEGGSDVVVHPSWEYDVPDLDPMLLLLFRPPSQTGFQFEVEVVADDVPAFTSTHTIQVLSDE